MRPRATSIKGCRSPCFSDTATTRDINKAQIHARRKGIKSLRAAHPRFASWRWKVLKLKAAHPARHKESHMKLVLVLAPSTGTKIRDDKDLRCGTG